MSCDYVYGNQLKIQYKLDNNKEICYTELELTCNKGYFL